MTSKLDKKCLFGFLWHRYFQNKSLGLLIRWLHIKNSQNRGTCPLMRTHFPGLSQWLGHCLARPGLGQEAFGAFEVPCLPLISTTGSSMTGSPQDCLSHLGMPLCWIINIYLYVPQTRFFTQSNFITLIYHLPIYHLTICLFCKRYVDYNFSLVSEDDLLIP